jgi:hypothetical protein
MPGKKQAPKKSVIGTRGGIEKKNVPNAWNTVTIIAANQAKTIELNARLVAAVMQADRMVRSSILADN